MIIISDGIPDEGQHEKILDYIKNQIKYKNHLIERQKNQEKKFNISIYPENSIYRMTCKRGMW